MFSVFLLFIGYWIESVSNIRVFHGDVQSSLNTILNRQTVDPNDITVNPALPFGDFIVGVRLLFSIFTGEVVTNILQSTSILDDYFILMFIRILFTATGILAIVYVISNRMF